MTATQTRSVIVEREFACPPQKLWRALTRPHLIAEWLMQNDFLAAVGHKFNLRTTPYGAWNGVIDCEVLVVEPEKTLSYSWNSGEGKLAVGTVVTLSLTPTQTGTHLRLEQTGFRADQVQNFAGAKHGWQNFLGKLDEVLAREA